MILKILIVITALIAFSLIALYLNFLTERKQVNKIWHSLETSSSNNIFTTEMVAELPQPVQRYFLHAIEPGTLLAKSVKLKMNGSFRLSTDKSWLPMEAEQIIRAFKGFVWQANIGSGLIKFIGGDYYFNNFGRIRFSIWGIIPVVNAHNQDITRSSIGRLVGESFWLPSALLPQNCVSWQVIDDNTIEANMKVDDESVTLTFVIDSNGKLLKMSLPRWGDKTEDGSYTYIPFGGEVLEERTFGGFTIPSQINAGWWFGTDKYFDFFRANIEQAEFF
ncbi:hypothetical protein IQ247_15940 [Plectonema cf. radiosum LEGE 06105]|uniref:Uncharacterized protein n=1 Tax=Plectonema cf. radiosum LEGE 06105 TaxID=945769 RepID=A0A8J7JTS3_9CYAN|nr:DUF6544 family protein [Plectonema radiosum]MBE9214139.1 hypothetical protein [Plectonema cf. radiosum LEGE 06105]